MPPSFEALISQNIGRIQYIARRYARGEDYEDILQEILLQLWRSYKTFEENSSVETWLYRVALNTAITWVRKSVKHKEVCRIIQSLHLESSQPGQESCQSAILEQFMRALSDTDANILMMYLDGLPAIEIANVIGISANAISARVSRLKRQFEQTYIGGPS